MAEYAKISGWVSSEFVANKYGLKYPDYIPLLHMFQIIIIYLP
jgi:hypothetical protein